MYVEREIFLILYIKLKFDYKFVGNICIKILFYDIVEFLYKFRIN